MAYSNNYRSKFGDTTFTKVFVGGLAWETETDEMRKYFQQFGEILEAVIISDKYTGKSKGYGFVTFRDPESARKSCDDPNPIIDGRRANCNIASLGRPRRSPPRGKNEVGYSLSYSGVPATLSSPAPLSPAVLVPHRPPLTTGVIYQPYGYPSYNPNYGFQQGSGGVYDTEAQHALYYNQMYGTTSSSSSSAYMYGYSLQTPRGTNSGGAASHQAYRIPSPSYLYYPTQIQSYPPPLPMSAQNHFPSSADPRTPQQSSTDAEEIEVVTSKSTIT